MYFSTHPGPVYPGTGFISAGNAVNIPLDAGPAIRVPVMEEKLSRRFEAFKRNWSGYARVFDSYYKDAGWLTIYADAKKLRGGLRAIAGYKAFFC